MRDQRYVRLHTNFKHHRAAGSECVDEQEREKIQAGADGLDGEAFETGLYAGGAVVSLMRSHDEWMATPHARALGALPVLTIEKVGEARPKPWTKEPWAEGDRPLSGVRVLDLSRVIAAPVAGRTLAGRARRRRAAGLWSQPAGRIPWLTIDTGRELSTFIELKSEEGRARMRELVAEADIFSQGFRPEAIAACGFSPEEAAKINPGIVYVTLSAYGHAGPWSGRRGFDLLVQTSTGFNHAEGVAAGVEGPKELPAQMLDHATGYLMAFGAMMAKARQAREGGSWHVRVSLAQTGRWLWNSPRAGRICAGGYQVRGHRAVHGGHAVRFPARRRTR